MWNDVKKSRNNIVYFLTENILRIRFYTIEFIINKKMNLAEKSLFTKNLLIFDIIYK